jgi:hypothetical protein
MTENIPCQYCKGHPLRMTGAELFPDRPEIAVRHYIVCRDCDAWVGCRPGTWTPLGDLADATLRMARRRAHEAFETVWRAAAHETRMSDDAARRAAYAWISSHVKGGAHVAGLALRECGEMVRMCGARNAVPAVVARLRSRPATLRQQVRK